MEAMPSRVSVGSMAAIYVGFFGGGSGLQRLQAPKTGRGQPKREEDKQRTEGRAKRGGFL